VALAAAERKTRIRLKFQRFSCLTDAVCLQLTELTRVADWRHLNVVGGESGLGLEPVPFER